MVSRDAASFCSAAYRASCSFSLVMSIVTPLYCAGRPSGSRVSMALLRNHRRLYYQQKHPCLPGRCPARRILFLCKVGKKAVRGGLFFYDLPVPFSSIRQHGEPLFDSSSHRTIILNYDTIFAQTVLCSFQTAGKVVCTIYFWTQVPSRTYNETRHLVPAIAKPGHKKHSTRKEKPWHFSKN